MNPLAAPRQLHLCLHLILRRWMPILLLTLMVSACSNPGPQNVAKDLFRFSIMTLNIAGALPDYSDPPITLPWRDRYIRIAEGLKAAGATPDVIALQEATARKEWVLSRDPQDYESLHYLISKIRAMIGIEYRIAYIGAAATGHPGLIQGQAVLYNPTRLKNVTKAPSALVQPGDSLPTSVGLQPRKSYPCDKPASEFKDSCSLLDGEGVYWTSVWADAQGSKHFETGAVRFAFTIDETAAFTFYNVHLHPTNPVETDRSSPAARDLIKYMEGLNYGGISLYPPIVAGDFNGGTERFPAFDTLAAGSPLETIDYIIAGKRNASTTAMPPSPSPSITSYASKYGISVARTSLLPNSSQNPDGMCAPRDVAWSDHCALLAWLEPAS